jgi:hypothetical protein
MDHLGIDFASLRMGFPFFRVFNFVCFHPIART